MILKHNLAYELCFLQLQINFLFFKPLVSCDIFILTTIHNKTILEFCIFLAADVDQTIVNGIIIIGFSSMFSMFLLFIVVIRRSESGSIIALLFVRECESVNNNAFTWTCYIWNCWSLQFIFVCSFSIMWWSVFITTLW